METINKLIYNALVSVEGIYLPEIGSLTVVNMPAKDLGNGQLSAPYMRVDFSSKQKEGVSDIIEVLKQNNVEGAKSAYKEWLATATQAKGLFIIEGVGKIQSKFFYPSKELAEVLGEPKKVELPKSKKKNKKCSVVIFLIAILVLAVIAFFALKSTDKPAPEPEVVVVAEPEPVVEPEPEPVVVVDTTPKNFHVIVGSYILRRNADSFVKANPTYTIIELEDTRTLVSAYAAATLNEAWNVMKKMQQDDPEVWVYQVK